MLAHPFASSVAILWALCVTDSMRRLVGLRRRGREKRSGKGVGVAGQFDLSPAQAVLRLLDVLLDGRWRPSNADLLTIKRMLVEEEDLRKPVAYQQQLLANSDQDDEVIPAAPSRSCPHLSVSLVCR